MNFRQRRPQGFTIVELLIVIVVIGILAAITIVAYNGIQARAENTKTVSGVADYVRTLKLYAADKGNYPVNAAYPCLGETGSTCGIIPGGNGCWGMGYVAGRGDFNNEILTQIKSLPKLSTQKTACNTGSSATGGFYYSTDGKTAGIYYFLRGDVDCGSPAGLVAVKAQSQDTTWCTGYLTTS